MFGRYTLSCAFQFSNAAYARMQKPVAIPDKSFLHELCLLPESKQSEALLRIEEKVRFVFPPIFIEELIASARGKQPPYPPEVVAMGRIVFERANHWLDDIYEVSFRELVLGQQFIGAGIAVPMAPPEYCNRVKALNIQDPEAIKWADERKGSLKQNRQSWRRGHAEYRDYKAVSYANDAEFFEALRQHFSLCLSNNALRNEFLENVLGDRFRALHADEAKAIAAAFQGYTEKSFSRYPVTTMLLFVRHVYWVGAVSPIGPNKKTQANFLTMDADNFADADYVASAQLCDQLITRDESMAKVAGLIHQNGLWPGGRVVYLPKGGDFEQQIESYLKT
jgi:hypothetical protein